MRTMSDRRPGGRARRAAAAAAPCPSSPRSPASAPRPSERPSTQSGTRHGEPGGGTISRRGAVPVEHRVERAGLRPFGDILLLFRSRDQRQVDVRPKLLSKNHSKPFASISLEAGRLEGIDILRCGALVGFSIRLFWKITGCGELTIASRASRGSPAAPPPRRPRRPNHARPARTARSERSASANMSSISLSVCNSRCPGRLVRSGKAALVGHDQPEASVSSGPAPPGAVRFGKAVEQDHRRRARSPASATLSVTPGLSATLRSSVTGS